MTTYYVNKAEPDLGGYTIFHGAGGYRWTWEEVAKGETFRDDGPWFGKASEALRDAASDWESNGSPANSRLGGTLRAAATRAEKGE